VHLHQCRCFQQHVRMLFHSLKALCKAPGGAGSIWKYLDALARAARVSGRMAYGFLTELHFADDALGSSYASMHSWNICSSAKNISVRAEWLRQSGCAPSEPSKTPRWQNTLHQAPIERVALHITDQSQFRRLLLLWRYPIVNDHCGVVANFDHTSEWVDWVRQHNV